MPDPAWTTRPLLPLCDISPFVGRSASSPAFRTAHDDGGPLFFARQRRSGDEPPRRHDVHAAGLLAEIVDTLQLPDAGSKNSRSLLVARGVDAFPRSPTRCEARRPPAELADLVAAHLPVPIAVGQAILDAVAVDDRLNLRLSATGGGGGFAHRAAPSNDLE